jgi:hypothetical protein
LETDLPELKVAEEQYMKAIETKPVDLGIVTTAVRQEYENSLCYVQCKKRLTAYTSHVNTLIDLYDYSCQTNKKLRKKI